MYAQQRGASGLPKNYSGNAFRYPPIGQPLPEAQDGEEQAVFRSAELPSGETPPYPLPTPALPAEKPLPPLRHGLAGIGQLIGSEELLLIGLFLLLSGHADKAEDEGGNLLFYLLLLLFCG